MSLPSDAVPVEIDRYGQGFQRRGRVQGTVRPVLIMVDLVRAQDPPQMGLVPDNGVVQELAPTSADPAFGYRVHARRPDVAQHGPDPGIGEDRVECGGEVRAVVADHELDPVRMLAEIHEQVAGLLGGPVPGGMQHDSENPDAPTGVLDHGQDIGLGPIEQVRREEVARQDRLGLGTQEQRPGRAGPPRRRIDASRVQDLPYRRRRDSYPQPGQFPVNPAVAQPGFSPVSRRTRALMFRRVAARPVLPRRDLAAQPRRTISRCQRRTVSGVTSRCSPWQRAFGITASRVARSARSAQSSLGRRGYRRCRTASRRRRIKISAVFHLSSRRASRSHEGSRVVRRNMNHRHMTGDHHGQTAGRATLLASAMDEILGTHRV